MIWWLLGAGVLGYAAYEYETGASSAPSTATTDTTWPPTKATQQGLASQAAQAIVQDQGSPLTGDQRDKLAKAMRQAPNEYVASLSGTTPTTSGYQAWFPSEIPLIEQAVTAASASAAQAQALAQSFGGLGAGSFGIPGAAHPNASAAHIREPGAEFRDASVAGWPEQCGPLFQDHNGAYWRGDCQ